MRDAFGTQLAAVIADAEEPNSALLCGKRHTAVKLTSANMSCWLPTVSPALVPMINGLLRKSE